MSQTNDNPEVTEEDKIYKFVDDKSVLELINLVSIGMASQNIKIHVPSNIPTSNLFIPSDNLRTQKFMSDLEVWTRGKQMKLNVKKTKNMIFNFSKKYQFNTDIKLEGETVETIKQTKLLGAIITDDLSWNRNTAKLVKDGNLRMQFLHKAAKFTNNANDLKQIYISQVRGKLEQSAVVWHSSLTKRNESDIERIQRSALKIILKDRYDNYQDALKALDLQTLKDRREYLCLKFAKNCLKIEKFKRFFPVNNKLHKMSTRNVEKFALTRGSSSRYVKSAIPSMIRLLNDSELEKTKVLKAISACAKPMNYDSCMSYHCVNKN